VLHDQLTPDRVVDSEAALEFMKEATKLATNAELEDIGERLDAKSADIGRLLGVGEIASLDEDGFKCLLGMMFSLRRKSGRLIRANGMDTLRDELSLLLYGGGSPAERLDRFTGAVNGVEEAMVLALATECLHFTDPRRYWLWTHWIWNPESGTGAMPLVVRDEVDLGGDTVGEIYNNIGRATAFVNAEGHSAGYAGSGRGLFGTDVFLACVYAVYMYTVFRVKLSQEFNRILPELPELVSRVLGVQSMGEQDA